MGHLYKFTHRLGVQVIRGGVSVVPFAGAGTLHPQDQDHPLHHVVIDSQDLPIHSCFFPGKPQASGLFTGQDLQGKSLGGVLVRIPAADHSPGRTGGPLILIIDPDLQILLRCLVHAQCQRIHPFPGEVWGLQPLSGMDKETAHSFFLHLTDLKLQILPVKEGVPPPKGGAPELFVRMFPLSQERM